MTIRRLWCRFLCHGSGKNVHSSRTEPGAIRCSSDQTASTEQNRTLRAPASATRPIASATPGPPDLERQHVDVGTRARPAPRSPRPPRGRSRRPAAPRGRTTRPARSPARSTASSGITPRLVVGLPRGLLRGVNRLPRRAYVSTSRTRRPSSVSFSCGRAGRRSSVMASSSRGSGRRGPVARGPDPQIAHRVSRLSAGAPRTSTTGSRGSALARLAPRPAAAAGRRRRTAPDRGPGPSWWFSWSVTSGDHLVILVTRPAPTVRPPSRIAKRRPSSMAMGWISSTDISVLSPGMTISVPSGRVTTPVTSVVRK